MSDLLSYLNSFFITLHLIPLQLQKSLLRLHNNILTRIPSIYSVHLQAKTV